MTIYYAKMKTENGKRYTLVSSSKITLFLETKGFTKRKGDKVVSTGKRKKVLVIT